ncbi:signal recognition particle-docking protein FtsY [Candidatus Woesearchaeota archaeon]|nr:signal recognition particle-docking protein FtsY [Candidatus Woesearchaeota archaeon]
MSEEEFEETKEELLEEEPSEETKEEQKITEEITQEIPILEEKEEVIEEKKIEDVVKRIREKREKPSTKELLDEFEETPEELEKEEIKPVHEEIFEKATEPEIKKTEPPFFEEKREKGFFSRIKEKITTTKINEGKFDELFWDLELVMLENNVAVEVIEKIKQDLRREVVEQPIPRGKVEEFVMESLKNSVRGILKESNTDLLKIIKQKKPFIICFVGINGSGKTTTIAKFAKLLQENKLSVVLAAADTFRAAAIEQLQTHADRLGAKIVKHDYGADEAAVAYDAIEHAKAKNKDVVLIDTAGRLHSNHNLVEEMKKIIKVAKPDLKIFVGESITGNDCVEQAQKFNEAIELDGIILSKTDIDEKGGAALSVSYVTGKPIFYLGTGQNYKDLEKFSKEKIMTRLGL